MENVAEILKNTCLLQHLAINRGKDLLVADGHAMPKHTHNIAISYNRITVDFTCGDETLVASLDTEQLSMRDCDWKKHIEQLKHKS